MLGGRPATAFALALLADVWQMARGQVEAAGDCEAIDQAVPDVQLLQARFGLRATAADGASAGLQAAAADGASAGVFPTDEERFRLSDPTNSTNPDLTFLNDTFRYRASNPDYGLPGCPCIGIEFLRKWFINNTVVGKEIFYPGDWGTRCEDPTLGTTECEGDAPPWYCNYGKWCYVDGCNCNVSHEFVAHSDFRSFPMVQGHAISVSTATCGSPNASQPEAVRNQTVAYLAYENISMTCDPLPDNITGDDACECIGMSNMYGTVTAHINGSNYSYPADLGTYCSDWDEDRHPDCQGSSQPDWCSQRWCYVDPCRCNIGTPPKVSTYLPKVTYRGKPLFYSYATCGQQDGYSSSKATNESQAMIGAMC
uniref:Uncharacterized protein n=1 Tax=Alexandrium catenella TaxID=2925 RepID=A0A7S1WJC4_ALECA